MKTTRYRDQGWTLIELLAVAAVMLVPLLLLSILLPAFAKARSKSIRANCTNQSKQVGLAFRLWSADHNENYPMRVSVANGGTMEFVGTAQTFRHFQVMSNELNSPKILI